MMRISATGPPESLPLQPLARHRPRATLFLCHAGGYGAWSRTARHNAAQAESARPFEPGACRSRGEMGRSAAALALPATRAAEALRPGPDQAVAGALLVRDQVGEDRGGEARIIEPDLVVAPAALLRGLGPRGPELDAVRDEA